MRSDRQTKKDWALLGLQRIGQATDPLIEPATPAATTYLSAAQVRSRYGGVSDMALWRWLHNDKLGFPKPFRINGRRFWREADLDTWERSRAREASASSDRQRAA